MLRKGVVVFSGTPRPNGCTCGRPEIPALECVANRPIAHHVLDALIAAGVEEVVIAGTADDLIDIRACLATYPGQPLGFQYAICPESSDTVAKLRAAAPLVGAAPCVVHLGDGLLNEPLGPHIKALEDTALDLVVLRQGPAGYELPMRPTESARSASRGMHAVICDAGIGLFGPGVLDAASRINGGREPSDLNALARCLSEEGRDVRILRAEGWRQYRGDRKDLLEVNRLALDLLGPPSGPVEGSRNRIEGRVHIDRTASVTTSVIVGPVVVGPGAEVTNAYIGPYTSIGARARIEGAEIERSIIAPGASVMHVGARLVSSLVGQRAHVFRDFTLPRAMRLCVGEGDEIALC